MSLSPQAELPLCYASRSPCWRRRPLGNLQTAAMGETRIFSTTGAINGPDPWQHLGLPNCLPVAQVSLLDNALTTTWLNTDHL